MGSVVAYLSMEIAVDTTLPTYSGGLGVLAGDTIKAAADLGIPMVAVTLLHRKGYVRQEISPTGEQIDNPEYWEPEKFLKPCGVTVDVPLHDRVVAVQAWRWSEVGVTGHTVPVIFLDTDIPENTPDDRRITDTLYGGDQYWRVLQELVLGIGGVRVLRALGYGHDCNYHLNEGHAAFLLAELLPADWESSEDLSLEQIRKKVLFTTHTPVAAGHDVFPRSLLEPTLSAVHFARIRPVMCDDSLNMTKLAMRCAGTVNAVAYKHMEVSRQMFPEVDVVAITNGVHVTRWTSEPFVRLFDRYIPGWRQRGEQLRQAALIPCEDIAQAHREARDHLLKVVRERYGMPFAGSGILIGYARRSTEYKRPTLLFSDIERLKRIAERFGGINLLFAGKAHPRDGWGKQLIAEIHRISGMCGDSVRIAFLPNYDTELAYSLCAGVDLWLNTPRAPLEASGTSGMKCAINGVPSLSIADGWWLEGGFQDITGWVVKSPLNGGGASTGDQDRADAEALYQQLENHVLPCFYEHPGRYHEIMRNCIALNGSFFNTHRMVDQYRAMAYERYR